MFGTLITIRYGVRCIEVEAGWTRLPSHGVMREPLSHGANILHFGRKRQNECLRLDRGEDLPEWFREDGEIFRLDDTRSHLDRLFAD